MGKWKYRSVQITACVMTAVLSLLALSSCGGSEASSAESATGENVTKGTYGTLGSAYEYYLKTQESDSKKQLIKEIIYSKTSKKINNKTTDELLLELKEEDEDLYKVWKDITGYWDKVYDKDYVNIGVLPDGLPDDDSLCIVCLGYELNADGSMKQELIDRLTVAYESAVKYPNAYVLLTGGGTAALNPSVTEADSMANYLISKGIDSNRIIVENKSLGTDTNAVYSANILSSRYPSVNKITIISSDYHIGWGSTLFYAEFKYMAYSKNASVRYEIISNAACETNIYDNLEYLPYQLWWIADSY